MGYGGVECEPEVAAAQQHRRAAGPGRRLSCSSRHEAAGEEEERREEQRGEGEVEVEAQVAEVKVPAGRAVEDASAGREWAEAALRQSTTARRRTAASPE